MLKWKAWRGALTAARAALTTVRGKLSQRRSWVIESWRVAYAIAWQRVHIIRIRAANWLNHRSKRIGGLVVATLMIGSFEISPIFEPQLHFLGDKEHLASVQQFLVTLGGALIGATAIAFSLIMFAMQVNVDRMPHGLFRKFGSDVRLLAAFISTFVLATGIAVASLIVEQKSIVEALMLAMWSTLLILLLFLNAYRRALVLISPSEQLRIVVATAHADMQRWVKRAKRLEPLLSKGLAAAQGDKPNDAASVDVPRTTFFRLFPSWTDGAVEALQYAIAFARRFAERGDHEVASAALNAIVAINASYTKAKGNTFFATNILIDSPFSSDGLINDSLEHLRQNVKLGLSRGDERQVEETFRAMTALAQVYLTIKYANGYATKTHANLAAGYLSSAVEACAPHNMPDVLMEGLRHMGSLAERMAFESESEAVAMGSEKIQLISVAGIARADHLPVTVCGVEQLVQVTLALVRNTSNRDIDFAISQVRNDLFTLAMLIVTRMNDTPLQSVHSIALAPYFSLTSANSLPTTLSQVVNAIVDAPEDDERAKRVVDRVEEWADDLFDPYKKLLLAAVAKRSGLTFDLLHWVRHVTTWLLAIASSAACSEHSRQELETDAKWLISTLSWIPDDRDSVTHVEASRPADILFEVAVDAFRFQYTQFAEEVCDLLLQWAFKAGRYHTGWASLQTALCGASAICALGIVSRAKLMNDVDTYLQRPEAPEPKIRHQAARRMRETAQQLRHNAYAFSSIDSAMGSVDAALLRPIIEDVAAKLDLEAHQSQ